MELGNCWALVIFAETKHYAIQKIITEIILCKLNGHKSSLEQMYEIKQKSRSNWLGQKVQL